MIKLDLSKFANKKFGQNFLKDELYLHKIIQSMPKDDKSIVEIGPGLGDLTNELLKEEKCVIAFEVDKRLCEHLKSTFKDSIDNKSLELRCGDVLDSWENGILLDKPYNLVANLPYYIATHIILKALKDKQCQSILVMVQKEVADKFAAKPKQKEFSSLSVLARSIGEPIICFDVPPSAFVPQPKVTSAVLKITKEKSLEDEGFEEFLRAAFAQPRKKLIRNLSNIVDMHILEEKFKSLEMDTNIRPHEATMAQYENIYKFIKETFNGK
ncbi:MAG: 16S rRNA (adenine(1518)-N(6)/adenine(1519)-N(6))-dimethyltransferase RsmA [Sulfurovaceae bacterium]|nr:16S rRNA (adenine(1518)-N(6)/adenine(1519)-N(6))-dimethyltransferase RsmA [Sulfurovaceae bacterium]